MKIWTRIEKREAEILQIQNRILQTVEYISREPKSIWKEKIKFEFEFYKSSATLCRAKRRKLCDNLCVESLRNIVWNWEEFSGSEEYYIIVSSQYVTMQQSEVKFWHICNIKCEMVNCSMKMQVITTVNNKKKNFFLSSVCIFRRIGKWFQCIYKRLQIVFKSKKYFDNF